MLCYVMFVNYSLVRQIHLFPRCRDYISLISSVRDLISGMLAIY